MTRPTLRLIPALAALAVVAACGVNGPPKEREQIIRPTSANGMDIELGADTRSGVTVSGNARFGVVTRR
ncbi:hypothetical protein ACX9MO_11730 [Pseudooceanicola sp. 502str34]|uniref:hypothetical protein n=1 Tax=Maritimibacter alkaliphilus TaxID=404236 RepID=UPI001C98BB91|nr:hypothetical protein [Maritimibacter alkaliphilus]MBY6091991.1 hypothetical protein [Maritimibacter alkaliphilus]